MKVIVRTYGANATEEIVVERDADIAIGKEADGSLVLTVQSDWGGEAVIARSGANNWRAAWIAEEEVINAPDDLSNEAYADDDEGPF